MTVRITYYNVEFVIKMYKFVNDGFLKKTAIFILTNILENYNNLLENNVLTPNLKEF